MSRKGDGRNRLAKSLVTLIDDIVERFPGRDDHNDGTIGDPRHRAIGKKSDHNPHVSQGGMGIVRGGVTKFGITLEELQSSRNDQSLTAEHLKDLTRDQALEIYRVRYWNVLKCDDLPLGVDLVVFDFGVDAGPSESAKVLQRAVGAEADGSIGPATMAATKVMAPRDRNEDVRASA